MGLTRWRKSKSCSITDSSRSKERRFWILTLKTRLLTRVLRLMSWWLTRAINFTTRPKRPQTLTRWKHVKKRLQSRNSLTVFFVETKWKASLPKSRDTSLRKKCWSVWMKLKRRSERTAAHMHPGTNRLTAKQLRLNTARRMGWEIQFICWWKMPRK